jgi:WD40-like Beta Propeller Repeat
MTFPDDHTTGDLDMAVSPDGRRLAICTTLSGEGCDLYVKNLPDGEVHRLTDEHRVIQGLAWTPDSSEIVFSSNRRGTFRLWRINARPKNPADPVLLPGAGDDARYPSIAGNQLVYERYTRNFDIARAEIAPSKGHAGSRLEPSQPLINSTGLDVAPAWSPDGRRIAFVSDRSGTREVWICDADGSNPRKLTSFGGPQIIYPRWSPDGARLVFSAVTGAGGNLEGYVIAAAGGKPERIQAAGRPTMAHPIFSHDGRTIYFIPGPKEGSVHAWKMPAGGGDALQVTTGDAFRPEESADGTMLYYGKFGVPGIWSTPTAGGQERQVLTSVSDRNWTVTPKGIYYFDRAAARSSRTPLMFHDFDSKKTVPAGAVDATISEDFSSISVSPDGRWLLYSHIANVDSDLMLLSRLRW